MLNAAQKEAVEYIGGPLMIVAGAGTGKTSVITEKIAFLIKNKLAQPNEILALTFTDKAAAEMVDRVDALLESSYTDVAISTFHAFAQRVLEERGFDIGLPNRFKLLTQTDAWLLVRENFAAFDLQYYRPLAHPNRHIHELIKHFGKCKDELVSPAAYLEYAQSRVLDGGDMNVEEKNRLTEIANAYHVYNRTLLDNNGLDFGDLIFYTLQLFTQRLNVLEQYQKRFKFILVDEFQDVNWSQYRLVQLLAGRAQLTVVGDDDQSIYAFRGASVANILRFKDDFPSAKEVVLTENYRSDQRILDTAYRLIQNNNPDRLEAKLQINKRLVAQPNVYQNAGVEQIQVGTIEQEVAWVLDTMVTLKQENTNLAWSDMAILVRANSHAENYVAALEKQGIPYEFSAASGLYRQPIVLDSMSFFKLMHNFHESTALYRLFNLPFLDLKAEDIHQFTHNAKKKSISYFEALKRVREGNMSVGAVQTMEKLLHLLQELMSRVKTEKPSVLLYAFLEKIGYLTYLTHEENVGNISVIRQINYLKQFFEYLNDYENANLEKSNITDFLEHYGHIMESGDEGEVVSDEYALEDRVNILTIHASKGLEFRYVFLVNMVEDRFPSRRRSEALELPVELVHEQLPGGDAHIEEERRLCYVAITRAKEKIFLLSAESYGGVRTRKISRFITEMGFTVTEKKAATVSSPSILPIVTRQEETGVFRYPLPDAFSFSQLKSYENCPYQYKLAHILKIPTKSNASFSFGQTMHSALQKFYERIQALNKMQQISLFDPPASALPAAATDQKVKVPTLPELLEIYQTAWIPDWFRDEKQRLTYFEKGKDILREFYHQQATLGWTIPVSLEGWFKIKLGKSVLHGRIDRIDQLPDGTLEIIDYKTGQSKEKLVGGDKDQLLIYQLAVEQLPQYRYLGAPSTLTFYYLNDNIKLSFLGSPKELDTLSTKLQEIIERIHAQDFAANPSTYVCNSCEFKDICEFRIL